MLPFPDNHTFDTFVVRVAHAGQLRQFRRDVEAVAMTAQVAACGGWPAPVLSAAAENFRLAAFSVRLSVAWVTVRVMVTLALKVLVAASGTNDSA